MDLLALLQAFFAAVGREAPEGLLSLVERFQGQPRRDADGNLPAEDPENPYLTDEELDTLLAAIQSLGAEDEASATLINQAANMADEVRSEQDAREAESAAEEEARQEGLRRLAGEASDDEPAPGEGEGDDGDEGDGGGGDGGDGAPETPDEGGDDEQAQPGTPAEPQPEAISAASLERAARRRAARASQPQDTPPASGRRTVITAAADIPDQPAGGVLESMDDVDRILLARAQDYQGVPGFGRVRLARLTTEYPTERRLVGDPVENARIVTAALRDAIADGAPRPRVAAGGLCAPLLPIYSVDVFGDDRRPVRDTALTSFQAGGERGGVVSMAPPILPNLAGSSIIWTEANDADPGSDGPATKPCLRVECGTPRETKMYAVPVCLTYGNFMAMTYGEWTQAWSTLAGVAQARLAEQTMLARIKALSVEPNAVPTTTSAVADTLIALDTAREGFLSRRRASRGTQFRVIGPETWLLKARNNMARALPGGSFQENLVLSDAAIQGWFSSRNMNVTWSPDLGVIGEQAAATDLAQPDPSMEWSIAPEGTFIGFDRARLDLGIQRDPALVAVNDLQVWYEDFEAVHLLGSDPLWLTINACDSGAVHGTLDPAAFCASYT